MTPKFSRDQVFAGVREDVADCLAIEPEEVTLDSNFRLDLGGESIDNLDLSFRLEKRFGIRSPFPRLANPDAVQFNEGGGLSDKSMQWWQTEFPQNDWSQRMSTMTLQKPADLLTIQLIVDLFYCAQFERPCPDKVEVFPVATGLSL